MVDLVGNSHVSPLCTQGKEAGMFFGVTVLAGEGQHTLICLCLTLLDWSRVTCLTLSLCSLNSNLEIVLFFLFKSSKPPMLVPHF